MASSSNQHAFLDQGGAMGERIRVHDWSGHPLGPLSGWAPALRTGLGIVLGSAFPTFLAWGEDLALFFNDAYVPMLGQKADGALGASYPAVWPEAWPKLAAYVRRVLGGESFFFEDYAVTLERHGYPEQAWFTFSYSPLRDELGVVRGLICTVVEMSEKMAALARHKEAEERLALSLEASGNIGTWSYDLATGATHVDARFARLFQVDAALAREGTELARFTDMIHPDERPAVLAAIEHAIRTETLYDVEYRIPQRAGHDVWVNARGKVFADPAGGGRRFAGIAVDISERKAQAEALRVSQQLASAASLRAENDRRRLDALLEAAPVGIFYIDRGGRLLIGNAANEAIWGDYPQPGSVDEYVEWKGWHTEGPAAGAPLAPQDWPVARVLAGRDSDAGVFEIEPFGSPGTRRTVLVRAAAMRDARGERTGAVAAHMDISAQVAAEKALKDSEGRFRAIANVIPQMVWSSSVENGAYYFNERWSDFTGIPTVRLQNDGWRDAVHPDDLAPLLARWERSRAVAEPFEFEHRLLHHTGQYRWVLSRALPFAAEDGRVTDWMGTLTDIHAQKTGEAELRAAARRKDEFLAMLAHELRNPLAPISNAAQLLAMPGLDERRLRYSSEIIGRQVRHMTDLVDDLLDVSRVTRGLVQLDRSLVDIGAAVAGAVEQARPLIEARGHAFELQVEGGGWVDGDRTRLVQVFANLLNNAAKYTPQGGRIALSVQRGRDSVTVAVRDTGIGIAADMLPHVFDLFTQAERTPDRSQGGLGLGLALVKSLVQLHGGSVEAHSAGLGQGSTFSVTLGLIAQDKESAAAMASAPAAPAPHAGRARILIVDDNLDAAHSLAEVLRAFGHVVTTAASSRAALEMAAADWPQVFILDIGLPDIDGYELVRRLRELQGARPALYLALTGYGQAHDRVLSRSAGFDHHFVKPVDLRALVAVIDGIGAAP
ncbi:MAG: PAS domain S-box protein [Pseudomonadota bacterium]